MEQLGQEKELNKGSDNDSDDESCASSEGFSEKDDNDSDDYGDEDANPKVSAKDEFVVVQFGNIVAFFRTKDCRLLIV